MGVSGAMEDDVVIFRDQDGGCSEGGLAAIIAELSDGNEVGGSKVWKRVCSASCLGEARNV